MDIRIHSLLTLPPAEATEGEDTAPRAEVRLLLVDVAALAAEAVVRHLPSNGVAMALTQLTTATALLGAMIKGEERLGVQLVCDGPAGSFMVEATGEGTFRAWVRVPEAAGFGPDAEAQALSVLGTRGDFHVMRSLRGQILQQGAAPLSRLGIQATVEAYLRQSEQLSSEVVLACAIDEHGFVTQARGALFQVLGGTDRARVERWFAGLDKAAVAAALGAGELGIEALTPLFPGVFAQEMDRLELRFKCLCSRERAQSTLAALGRESLVELVRERGGTEVDCHFCREVYPFTAEELTAIADGLEAAPPGESIH